MEPIISPWFIYFLGVVESLGVVLAVLLFVLAIGAIVFAIFYVVNRVNYDEDDKDVIKSKKALKICLYPLIIVSLIGVFLPSKSTLIAMYVADNITPNNVEKALEVGENFKEEIKKDIFELIEAIQKDENKSNE